MHLTFNIIYNINVIYSIQNESIPDINSRTSMLREILGIHFKQKVTNLKDHLTQFTDVTCFDVLNDLKKEKVAEISELSSNYEKKIKEKCEEIESYVTLKDSSNEFNSNRSSTLSAFSTMYDDKFRKYIDTLYDSKKLFADKLNDKKCLDNKYSMNLLKTTALECLNDISKKIDFHLLENVDDISSKMVKSARSKEEKVKFLVEEKSIELREFFCKSNGQYSPSAVLFEGTQVDLSQKALLGKLIYGYIDKVHQCNDSMLETIISYKLRGLTDGKF